MAGLNTHVVKLDRSQGIVLHARLLEEDFEFYDVAYAEYAARRPGVNIVFYKSGKLVVQGKQAREQLSALLPDVMPATPMLAKATIGADESGKGDYFGPLVCAACMLDPHIAQFLDEVPLRDSKTMSAREISDAADVLKRVLPHEIVVINPRKYNEMYDSFGNLNSLLAWAHAKAILAVVDKTKVTSVLLDKFCDERVVMKALGPRGEMLDFTMRVRAESDPAVAAASILARDAFVRGVARLEREHGVKLPLGCGTPVDRAVRGIVLDKGVAVLEDVAKLHFKTTDKHIGPGGVLRT